MKESRIKPYDMDGRRSDILLVYDVLIAYLLYTYSCICVLRIYSFIYCHRLLNFLKASNEFSKTIFSQLFLIYTDLKIESGFRFQFIGQSVNTGCPRRRNAALASDFLFLIFFIFIYTHTLCFISFLFPPHSCESSFVFVALLLFVFLIFVLFDSKCL